MARLKRCMYGTRDAGAIWETCYSQALASAGFEQRKASPCCFYHREWQVSVVVHGDGFTALGTDDSLQKHEDGMMSRFELKIKGRLAPEPRDLKEMVVLNRIVRITGDGLLYEPDPGHVELLVRALHLEDANPAATPGFKMSIPDGPDNPSAESIESLLAAVHAHKKSFGVKVGDAEIFPFVNNPDAPVTRNHLLVGTLGSLQSLRLNLATIFPPDFHMLISEIKQQNFNDAVDTHDPNN